MLLALSLLWGSSWIANEMLREQAGPMRLTMLRYLLGGVICAVASGARALVLRLRLRGQGAGRASGAPATRWFAVSVVLGCTFFGVPDLLLVWAAQHGSAAWTPLVYAGLPLGLWLAAGELRVPAILGVGAMLVLLNGSLPVSAGRLGWVLPIVAAVALQGWSLVYARRHLAAAGSLRGVAVQLLVAAGMVRGALLLWPEAVRNEAWPGSSLGALCLLAVLGTAVAYPLYYRLLSTLEPGQLATSEWLQTLVAIAESAVLVHQRPGWAMIGAAGALVGCAAVVLRGSRQEIGGMLGLSS
jgi:drug/metabolite transporter (DMT)-like permease